MLLPRRPSRQKTLWVATLIWAPMLVWALPWDGRRPDWLEEPLAGTVSAWMLSFIAAPLLPALVELLGAVRRRWLAQFALISMWALAAAVLAVSSLLLGFLVVEVDPTLPALGGMAAFLVSAAAANRIALQTRTPGKRLVIGLATLGVMLSGVAIVVLARSAGRDLAFLLGSGPAAAMWTWKGPVVGGGLLTAALLDRYHRRMPPRHRAMGVLSLAAVALSIWVAARPYRFGREWVSEDIRSILGARITPDGQLVITALPFARRLPSVAI